MRAPCFHGPDIIPFLKIQSGKRGNSSARQRPTICNRALGCAAPESLESIRRSTVALGIKILLEGGWAFWSLKTGEINASLPRLEFSGN